MSVRSVVLNVYEAGEGFPILCLHGHPGSGASLSVFTRHLSRRFRTLAPDLRGYGSSQAPAEFAIADHLLDLEALLDRYNVSRCLILGWSLGGILAMELALKLPERVSGLVLIASAARPWGNHPPVTWQDNFYTGLASLINWISPGWQWNIDTFGRRSLYRYLVQQHTPATYRYLASEAMPAYIKTSAAAHRALDKALKTSYNRLEQLAQIRVPCLVLAGALDRHIVPEASFETAQCLKSSWICYPNTAHLFPWEEPQQVLQDVDHWLALYPEATASPISALG